MLFLLLKAILITFKTTAACATIADVWSRYLNGKVVKSADYDALVELATICSLCNDSSVDYNEARRQILAKTTQYFMQ